MEKNKNDKRNQQSDGKSNQQSTQVGKKKETDPINPTANKDKQQGSKHGDQQRQDSTSTQGKKNIDVQDTDEKESKTGNQNTKKRNL